MFRKTHSAHILLKWSTGLLIGILGLVFSAHGQTSDIIESRTHIENYSAPATKPYQLKVLFKTGMAQYSTLSDERTAGSLRIESLFDYKLVDGLTFRADVRLTMLSQRTQQDISSDAFDEGFRLKQGYLEFRPIKPVALDAGVVNQEKLFVPMPLLVDDRGFPGLAQVADFGNDELKVRLFAEEAIPTSRSLNANRIEKEKTPSYFSQGVKVEYKPIPSLLITPYALHYGFQNLPSVVAAESYTMGNSVMAGVATSNSTFRYAFDGVAAGLSAEYHFSEQYIGSIGYHAIRNLQAPTAFNAGGILTGEFCFCFSTFAIRPGMLSFYNESDTSPASYNDLRFGHNNREGYGGQLRVDFIKWKFSATGRYVGADVINETANRQSRSEYFEIFLETNYADLL